MSDNEERARSLISQQAADWFVANRAGLSADERPAFATWLRASPVHVEEYLQIASVARDLRQACADPGNSVEAIVARARAEEHRTVEPLWPRIIAAVGAPSRLWQTAAVTMATFGAVSLGLLLLWSLRPVPHAAAPEQATALHFETQHGEQRTYRLADQSVLHLNSDSVVSVRYSKTERLVMLASGEAEFEVEHERARPFRVLAGAAQVVDLGTQFDVRMGDESTVVTVVEGRVAVALAPPLGSGGAPANGSRTPQFVQLGAGEQISVAADQWPARPHAVDAQRSTAWLHRQIIFEHEPLSRVAAEFNRYTPKPIEITTPGLRSLEISGVFATDDPEAFIAFLRSLEGVQVQVTARRILVSQK